MITIPMPPEPTPARAERERIVAASLTSTMPHASRLTLWASTDRAVAAAESDTPFSISIEDLADCSGLSIGLVSECVSQLIELGWIARIDGHWTPTVPAAPSPAALRSTP